MVSALLVYDLLLSFNQEISEIWRGQFTLAKLFYIMNRYGMLMWFLTGAVADVLVTDNVQVRSTSFFSHSV